MDIRITWLTRLRWAIALGQLALVGLVVGGIAPAWPVEPVLAFIAIGALSNLALSIRGVASEARLAAVLGLDTVLLTGLLVATGGTSSPMSTLYLVPVMAAAFTLRPALVWLTVGATSLEYGALFLFGPAPPHHHGHAEMQAHVFGMFAAFAFTAPLLALAVSRVRQASEDASEQMGEARALQSRSEHLASLATLAAGAAHELSTPLSTILLVARELERGAAEGAVRDDLQLIREEVLRCQDVLQQMSADAGAGMAEAIEPVALGALIEETLGHGARFEPVEVALEVPAESELRVARRLLAQALRRLLGNARDAVGPGEPVTLRVHREGGELSISVVDKGEGMDAETLRRAVEPFFTTKPEGKGSGLGLYFARAVVTHQGGRLELISAPDAGTIATIRLPLQTEVR